MMAMTSALNAHPFQRLPQDLPSAGPGRCLGFISFPNRRPVRCNADEVK